jgi:uncharacterized protein
MNECIEERSLAARLEPRIEVEKLFARTGRTYRKGPFELWYKRRVEPRVLKLALQTAGLYGRGVRNALAPIVRSLQFRFSSLPPAFHGFQILHLSDFHIDGNAALAHKLVPILDGLRPDLCVFTGDYRFDVQGACDAIYPLMRILIPSIHSKQGIVGILGNHDAAEIALALEEFGVRMLVNESIEIRRQNASIWLAGIDDPFDYRCDDLPAALSGIPAEAFRILLAHAPDRLEQAAARGVDLYLCGHTHAGQIRLPLVGSLKHNSKMPRAFSYGAWAHGGMQGYTTAGVGCSALRVRYNCPPELALIQLLAG